MPAASAACSTVGVRPFSNRERAAPTRASRVRCFCRIRPVDSYGTSMPSWYRSPMNDPVVTDPQLYRVVWENERVRVLEYRDAPGDATHLHAHPDTVMVTLSSFQRVIAAGGR